MANLHIDEFSGLPQGGTAYPTVAQLPKMPPLAVSVVAIGASSAASSAFTASTTMVGLHPKADCHVAFGSNPTATTNNTPLVSGQTYYFSVTPGDKVAVIQA